MFDRPRDCWIDAEGQKIALKAGTMHMQIARQTFPETLDLAGWQTNQYAMTKGWIRVFISQGCFHAEFDQGHASHVAKKVLWRFVSSEIEFERYHFEDSVSLQSVSLNTKMDAQRFCGKFINSTKVL